MPSSASDIGIIGLGTMGRALARNIERHGFRVSVYNRTAATMYAFVRTYPSGAFVGHETIRTFVRSIKRPRKIIIMIPEGKPVDMVLHGILQYLDRGDLVVDGGNSFYRDTARRETMARARGILFSGCGISGGPAGALRGASIMVGGTRRAYTRMASIYKAIAATDTGGEACVTYVGPGGAGQYVKMVHNGIEYGIMQLIAEVYHALRVTQDMDPIEIAEVFDTWSRGRLGGYLVESVVTVLRKGCDTESAQCLIYTILDRVSQHGTGKWTVIDALDRGVAVPTIAEAVFSRYISTEKEQRVSLERLHHTTYRKKRLSRAQCVRMMEDAMYAALVSVLAQGYHLMTRASDDEGWNINMQEISRVWEGGSIIRSRALSVLRGAYTMHGGNTTHIFGLPAIAALMRTHRGALQSCVSVLSEVGIPHVGFSSALGYLAAMTEDRLPAHIIAGLRDYFGGHEYERIEKPGTFHTSWEE